MSKTFVWKAYWFTTSEEYFFTRKPTIVDIREAAKCWDTNISDWEIHKFKVTDNSDEN